MQSAKSLQQLPVGSQLASSTARVVGGGTVQVSHISNGPSELPNVVHLSKRRPAPSGVTGLTKAGPPY